VIINGLSFPSLDRSNEGATATLGTRLNVEDVRAFYPGLPLLTLSSGSSQEATDGCVAKIFEISTSIMDNR